MGEYTAIIKCEKCKRVLSTIEAYHEAKVGFLVPQDIMSQEFGSSPMFCQACLNGSQEDIEEV